MIKSKDWLTLNHGWLDSFIPVTTSEKSNNTVRLLQPVQIWWRLRECVSVRLMLRLNQVRSIIWMRQEFSMCEFTVLKWFSLTLFFLIYLILFLFFLSTSLLQDTFWSWLINQCDCWCKQCKGLFKHFMFHQRQWKQQVSPQNHWPVQITTMLCHSCFQVSLSQEISDCAFPSLGDNATAKNIYKIKTLTAAPLPKFSWHSLTPAAIKNCWSHLEIIDFDDGVL